MSTIRVAINGAGRIGRAFIKVALEKPELEIVAVNDLGDIDNIAYLLKYDTSYGKSSFDISVEKGEKNYLVVGGKKILMVSQKDPALLPWKELDIDVAVESTGLFTEYGKAYAHVVAGAKKVVISAPAKGDAPEGVTCAMVLMGVNENELANAQISSNASCTTNAASPVIAILDKAIGIEKAMLNTVHAYTASQAIVDAPNKKDWREGRAGAQNIVPSTTGAAVATAKVHSQLAGKFDGISMRVPVVVGSIVDITFIAERDTTVEEVNKVLEDATKETQWKDVFSISNEELVSSDIVGSPFASIADLKFTRVVGGNLVKVLAWYDNEMGYTHTLVSHVIKTGSHLK